MKKNNKRKESSLNREENVAYRDCRGKEQSIKQKNKAPTAPDGISGDWG